MGAVGLNGASKDVSDPAERAKVAAAGWARWAPFPVAAIGAHLIGGDGLLLAHAAAGTARLKPAAAATATPRSCAPSAT